MQATAGMKATTGRITVGLTVGLPANAGVLAKVVKPTTACREANYSRDTVNIRDDSSSRDNRNIMDVNSSRTATISNSREDGYTQQGH
jgi:hypothetical protein